MAFEYYTSFVPVTYDKEERGAWIFKKEMLPVSPNPGSVYDDPVYQKHMSDMGRDGWELVSVQPLLRGLYQFQKDQHSGFGLGYSLTAGYYMFWKRAIK
ncbi:Uncharacterised protein [Burkholderia pseudomallei]|nr:Uncharacterised protein [Burkholderia pseudomallei]CAJ3911013.1 Uncharacterised protein [Burkholderia pseudomallei]